MSSETFENLEEDFLSFQKELKEKFNLLSKVSGENRKNMVRELQRDIDEAQKILHDLESELRTAPNPYRMQMNGRLKQYTLDLNKMKRNCLQTESSTLLSTRNELLGSNAQPSRPGFSAEISAASNRGRLLQMNETIERTSQSLSRTQQIAAETDQVGIAVVDELGTQREALIRTKERLVDTDANLSRSRKILRSMYRKVITNKLILIVIIIMELGILGGVIYYKFFSK